MTNKLSIAFLTTLVLSLPPLQEVATAQTGTEIESTSISDALLSGTTHLKFRYRYEFVDQSFDTSSGEPFSNNANASTLLLRLNYQTGKWQSWSGFTEFDYVGEVFLKDFNSGGGTSPGRAQYPVVADPKGADLNQLYLDYEGFSESRLRVGRQRISLDNERFVGGVGWRQNEQTYDSASGQFKWLPNTELFYAYVGATKRIFGERSPVGTHDMKTHLLNAKVTLGKNWSVVPYLYHIDNDDAPAFSTSTIGARLNGKVPVGDGAISLVAEIATQSDTANGPVNYSAEYVHAYGIWTLANKLSFGIGMESLGGNENTAGSAFRTPLATLHKFQGWADQFLSTPDAGVNDVFVDVGYQLGKWKLLGVYHDFSAESGSGSFGKEFDVSAARSLGDRYSVLFKAAVFSADAAAFSDVTKFWIMLTANY